MDHYSSVIDCLSLRRSDLTKYYELSREERALFYLHCQYNASGRRVACTSFPRIGRNVIWVLHHHYSQDYPEQMCVDIEEMLLESPAEPALNSDQKRHRLQLLGVYIGAASLAVAVINAFFRPWLGL